MKDIRIPKEAALEVFLKRTLPEFTARTIRAYPGAEKLPPDSLGALVSNTFNRGDATYSSDPNKNASLAEKRMVKDAIKNGDVDQIPALIESSKRVWEDKRRDNPDGTVDLERSGNYGRRVKEAILFQDGLDRERISRNNLQRP